MFAVECPGFEQELLEWQLTAVVGRHLPNAVCQLSVKHVHWLCPCKLELQLDQGNVIPVPCFEHMHCQ